MTEPIPATDVPNNDPLHAVPTLEYGRNRPGVLDIRPPLWGARRIPLERLMVFIIAIPMCCLLAAVFLPAVGLSHQQAYRIQCRSNLKRIGLAALQYANAQISGDRVFPRTRFLPYANGSAALTAGNLGTAGANPFGTVANFGAGANNVTSSMFLLISTGYARPDDFICPATSDNSPTSSRNRTSANWSDTLHNLSYSYNCPFPTQVAMQDGWIWDYSLGADDPMVADKNPGRGNVMANGSNAGTDVTAVRNSDGKQKMARGNSNNHNNDGQNVLFCDGHVDWWTTPFAGRVRPNCLFRDNIYTCDRPGISTPATADGSGDYLGPATGPGDAADAYLLPTCSSSGY